MNNQLATFVRFWMLALCGLWACAPVLAADTPSTNSVAAETSAATPPPTTGSATEFAPEQGLRMNFRGVPLEQVLNYLSAAAGFVIHPKVPISGQVNVWSDNPMSKDEAVDLLKHVLTDNGFAVLQDGRVLTIVPSYDVKHNDVPVRKFTSLADIPRTTDVATYIIPVHTLNPIALIRNLSPLIGADSDLQANESANSLLMTDTQINIRRVAELVVALDSVSSSINTIKVYPLKFADAKNIADLIKELFPSQDTRSSQGGGNGGGFAQFLAGGGQGGGFPGGGQQGGGNNNSSASGHTPGTRVTAVADEHANALVISAPDELVLTIDQLVEKMDQPVDDVTVVKVFQLKNADPGETADVLAGLFPDESASSDASTPPMQFGGGGPFGATAQNTATATGTGQRMKKLGHVSAVPDRRTQSLVVCAARDLMDQIESLITELDASAANKQRVFVASLKNADAQNVQQILQDLFVSTSTSSSSTSQQTDPLTSRSQTMLNSQFSSSATTGFSSSSSTGGTGGRTGN